MINDEGKDIDIKVYSEGALSDYIQFDRETYAIGPEGRDIPFTIKLPKLIPPGENEIDLVVEIDDPWFQEKKLAFAAKLRLVHELVISGEIPDKFIKATLEVDEQDTFLDISANVQNIGRKSLYSVQPFFKILDHEDVVDSFEINSKFLDPGTSDTFSKKLSIIDFNRGEYQLDALIEYDEKSLTLFQIVCCRRA